MNGELKIARLRAIALLMTGIAVATPAHAGLFDDEEARRQIAQQQKRIDDLRAQIDLIAARMAKTEDALKNQPVLDLANQLDTLREELKSLRGQIEVVNNSIESASKRQRDMYVDLDTRLRRFEQAATAVPPAPINAPPAGAPGAAAPAAPTASAAPAATAPATSEEMRAYEAAQSQRRIGNYQGAIAAFQAFVAQHPRSSLAPRAQYWIGDSYFNLRDYKNAIASQQKLIATYGDSSSVPDAMLNIASSQLEQGDTAAARKTMDGLVSRYPGSEAAEKAKRRLATLK
ncbi:MAG: tol-pal system protein YbgF [Rhodospirillaceae bacterium]